MTGSATGRLRTVLVTGGAGFIGSALCDRLCALGHQVVAYDNLTRGRRELLPDAVRLVQGDIRDARYVADVVAEVEPDEVVHLAALHFIPDCIARPRETMEINVEGTRHVLDACRASSVRRVIVASTAAVYAPSDVPCVEDSTPLGPLEIYGESKLATERLSVAFHQESGIATSILRLFNAVGRHETNPHVIPHIFESLQQSDVIRLGNIAPARDYIDTRDIADAIVAISACPPGRSVLNVGTGVAHTVRNIVDLLSHLLGRQIVVVEEAARMRPAERMLLVADTGKIRRETGWMPRITLKDSLQDLATAYGLRAATSPAS